METNKHYVRVGSFVLLTILAAALFSVWLVGVQEKSASMSYRILFAESVSGLDVGSSVKFRGVQIGKVETIAIDPTDTRLISVDINILKTVPIKTDTVASLKLQGITGDVYVELSGSSQKAPDLVSDNDKRNGTDQIPIIRSEASTLDAIVDMLPQLAKKISHMASQMDKLFSEKNVAALDDTIGNLQKASHDINKLTQSLNDNPSQLLTPSPKKEK